MQRSLLDCLRKPWPFSLRNKTYRTYQLDSLFSISTQKETPPSSPGKGVISRKNLRKFAKCNESREVQFRCTTYFLVTLLSRTTSNLLIFVAYSSLSEFLLLPSLENGLFQGRTSEKLRSATKRGRVCFRCTTHFLGALYLELPQISYLSLHYANYPSPSFTYLRGGVSRGKTSEKLRCATK
jgi:hypothetical protein